MENVVGVQVVNVLTGNHIDLFIPRFVEWPQLSKLLLLPFRQVGKILQDKRNVLHDKMNIIVTKTAPGTDQMQIQKKY